MTCPAADITVAALAAMRLRILVRIGNHLGTHASAETFLNFKFFDVLEIERVVFLEELHRERHLALVDKFGADKCSQLSGDFDIEGFRVFIDIPRIPSA